MEYLAYFFISTWVYIFYMGIGFIVMMIFTKKSKAVVEYFGNRPDILVMIIWHLWPISTLIFAIYLALGNAPPRAAKQ